MSIFVYFIFFFSLQMRLFNNYRFNEFWMYHRNGRRIVTSHSIRAFNMIFASHVKLITMVKAVLMFADRVMINLATIRAHQMAVLCAYLVGKETIVKKVRCYFPSQFTAKVQSHLITSQLGKIIHQIPKWNAPVWNVKINLIM